MLEMLDQATREQSGGMMLIYLSQSSLPNEAFVFERIGEEGRNLVRSLRQHSPGIDHLADLGKEWFFAWPQIRFQLKHRLLVLRDKLLAMLLGAENFRALRIGRFRLSGEVHHWMYDRYSLAQLLLAAGFQDPVIQTASRSLIPNWSDFSLDTLPDGTIVKPDSLFIEGTKPRLHP